MQIPLYPSESAFPASPFPGSGPLNCPELRVRVCAVWPLQTLGCRAQPADTPRLLLPYGSRTLRPSETSPPGALVITCGPASMGSTACTPAHGVRSRHSIRRSRSSWAPCHPSRYHAVRGTLVEPGRLMAARRSRPGRPAPGRAPPAGDGA